MTDLHQPNPVIEAATRGLDSYSDASAMSSLPPGSGKAVAYLRVSTTAQVNRDYDPEGISIPAQRRAVETKALDKNCEIVREFIEPGRSATSVEARPAFREMIQWVREQGDIDFVICYAFSRVFRSSVDAAVTKRTLKKAGCRVVSAVLDLGDGPEAEMVESVVHAVDQYQSEANGADVWYKMGEKAKKGGTITRAKLGYRNVRESKPGGGEIRTVVVDDERAPFIRQAFELYASGDWTLQALADELTTRGLRTRPGRYPAGPVSINKLRSMLRDPYYLGKISYQGEIYDGRHEPLVAQELFDRVQQVAEARSARGQRQRKHHHYLKGSLWCGVCHKAGRESRMVVSINSGNGGTYEYFVCTSKLAGTCDAPYARREEVEEGVADHYRTIMFPPHLRTTLRAVVDELLQEQQESLQALADQTRRELAKLEVQENNLLDLAADGTLPSAKIRARLREISSRREALQASHADSNERLAAGAEAVLETVELLSSAEELYRRAPDSGRRLLNQAVFERIYIDVEAVVDDRVRAPFGEFVALGRQVMDLTGGSHPAPKPESKNPPPEGWDLDSLLASLSDPAWIGSNKALVVREEGLEPSRPLGHWNLNPARLPIPPLARAAGRP